MGTNIRFSTSSEKHASVINMGNNGSAGAATRNMHSEQSQSTLNMPDADIPANFQDDFNWDEVSDDGSETDPSSTPTPKGFWRMHPLVRSFVIMIGGGIVLITPTIGVMASHPDLPFRSAIDLPPQPTVDTNDPKYLDLYHKYNLQCVARSFALLTSGWVFGVLAYHMIDMIPDGVLHVVRGFKGKRNIEKLKDRMQFFVAVKAYVKMIVISAISLISFVIMFPNASYRLIGKVENNDSSWDQVLFQVNVLVLISCGIIGSEKLLLKVVATRFHRSAYKERLQQQTYASWVLDHLNRSREHNSEGNQGNLTGSANTTPFMNQGDTFMTQSTDAMNSKRELLASSASPPPMIGRASTGNSFFSHKKKPPKSFASRLWNIKDRALEGGVDMNSNQYAGRLARKLFDALNNDRDYLVVDDFLPFFDKEEDAIKAFEFFDKDGNGDISKREMRDRIMLVYKERRSLINALSDMSQVVGKLDLFMTAFALLVIVIIALLVFGLDALKSLATMGTLFVGWSFVFGNTFKTVFECIIFLFQVHAYDVGDVVVIATETMTVSKIRLLSTVFFKGDGTYTVYPNSQLATQKIQNMRRSQPQSESISVAFDFHTPQEKLNALHDRMNEYVDEHPRDFSGPVGFTLDLLENVNRIQVSIGLNYKNNFQDSRRYSIKNKFAFALRQAICDLDLRYSNVLQPVSMVQSPPAYEAASRSGGSGDASDNDDEMLVGRYKNKRRDRDYNPGEGNGGNGGDSGAGGAGGADNSQAAMATVMFSGAL